MAPQSTSPQESRPVKRSAPRRAANGQRRRKPARARARTSEISELERIIRNLENQIATLTSRDNIRSTISGATDQVGSAVSKASGHVGDMAADMLIDAVDRLRGSATSVTGAARVGTGAMQKIGNELERRPFMTVAIALGIGFLAGLAGRREHVS
jgi:ElaB/YqjD/DUF883 family membrane-anchored ribosome-binding protein